MQDWLFEKKREDLEITCSIYTSRSSIMSAFSNNSSIVYRATKTSTRQSMSVSSSAVEKRMNTPTHKADPMETVNKQAISENLTLEKISPLTSSVSHQRQITSAVHSKSDTNQSLLKTGIQVSSRKQFPNPHPLSLSNCGNTKQVVRKWGRSLKCGNHTECEVVRPPGCPHPAPLTSCYPPPCQPCTTNIKMKCHYGLNNVSLSVETSWQQPCRRRRTWRAARTSASSWCPAATGAAISAPWLLHGGDMQEEGDEDQLPLQEEEGCVQVNGKDELVACDDICK